MLAIVPVSRSVSRGATASRAWAIRRRAASKASCTLSWSALIRSWINCRSRLPFRGGERRCCLGFNCTTPGLQKLAHLLFEQGYIPGDTPFHLVSAGNEFDAADEARLGLETRRRFPSQDFP